MKAAIITQHGGPEVVEIADVPRPTVPPGHVLLAVKAAGLNHLDLWVRRGLPGLPPKFPHIGGSDIAGTVAELGPDVERFTVGDRVLVNPGLSDGECEWCRKGQESLCVSYRLLGEHIDGGLAEFVSVPASNLLSLPDSFVFEEAAAIPLVFQTAWRALMSRARLQQGETVLITGASGGVSTAAIQIAKLAGATV
ncbi:MAG: alcohol dehydrogenase catalytic domain-containing protein, partial [Myxococcota bacterium]